MNYRDMEKIILKPWIDTDGIMKLVECDKNTAIKIRTDIEQNIIDSGLKVLLLVKRRFLLD